MNYLIIVADCLRYDSVPPLLSQFGKRCYRSSSHFAVSQCSDPNYVSMLSGLYPWEHGVYSMMSTHGFQLPDIPWLPTLIKEKGCQTFFSGFDADWARGFDAYCTYTTLEDKDRWKIFRLSLEIMKEMGAPYFGFIRDMCCHMPYRGRKYSGGVNWLDKELDRFLTAVLKTFPDTLIVITADHGEYLGDKVDDPHPPEREHQWGLYECLVHVPFMIYHPLIAPRASRAVSQHHQIFQTVGALAGLGPRRNRGKREGHGGQGLIPLLRGEARSLLESARFVSVGVEKGHLWQHVGVQRGRFKYVRSRHPEHGLFDFLFEVTRAGEKNILSPSSRVSRWKQELPRWPVLPEDEREVASKLEALGYF